MYLLNEIKHNVHKQYHGNYIDVKKLISCWKLAFKKKTSQKVLGVLKGYFCGFGCPNDAGICPAQMS